MPGRHRLFPFVAAVALPAALAAQTPAAAPDTVAGRVTGTGGAPVSGAQVYVTRGPDRLVLRDTTDADGRWQLVFTPGTGDYLVFIASPQASAPFRKRVQRAGTERRFVVDATLATVVAGAPGAAPGAPGAARPGAPGQGGGVQQLGGVRVVAQAPRPEREPRVPIGPTTGGNERLADGVADAVAPADQGNALATASTVPGIVMGPGGAAVLGASPDQSLVTLNGLANGGVVPRDANSRTRVASAAYDPSVGGFSGALVAVELQPGREFTTKRGSFTLDAPALRSTTTLAEAYGLAPRAFQGSFGQDGVLREDRLFYTTAVQASRRSASQASFADAGAEVLARNGLAPGDVAQVNGALAGLGLGALGPTPDRTVDNLSLIGQLDLTPRGNNARRLTAQLNASQSRGNAILPTALPSVTGETRDVSAALQFGSQAYVGRQRNRLNDFRASLSWARAEREPGRALPGGVVRLPDVVQDGDAAAVPSIRFGGLTQLEGTRDQWTAEVANDFTVDKGRPHRVTLHGWTRVDGVRDATLADARGTFAYQTLADLEAGRAASFTRTLAQPERTGTAWNGAAAISHRWAPSRVFQLLYGARVEGNAFLGAPAANPALAQALGVRTDVAPSAVHVSPRAGFTWYLHRREAGRMGMRGYGYAQHAILPVGQLRGGIGEFRGIYRPGTIADADGATGRPEDVRRIACVGAAVPIADWDGFGAPGAAFPTACAGGVPGLVDGAAPVVTLSPDYRPARSWRASLGWNSRVRTWFDYRIDGTYALNFDQPSTIDRNFAGVERFTLGGEGNRPVFVPVSAIDAASGAVSPIASRRATDFATVAERRSDLRGRAQQVTISVLPALRGRIGSRIFSSVAYTWANARSAARGFDGGTAFDPTATDWARTPFDVRHQIIGQLATPLPFGITMQLFARVQSGLPYTPLVAGDVNGDGRSGDRAFVPVAGAAGAPDLSPLLASAQGRVRRCLARQAGAIAGRNSCEGPWTQSTSLRLTIPGRRMGLGTRLNLGLQVANPAGAVDRLLNGRDAKGWGTDWTPDPVLLVPRAFDAATQRFTYDVNPQFGETRPSRVTQPIDPWGITLDARLDFSTPEAVQLLRRQLAPGRNGDPRPKLLQPQLQERYVRSIGNLWTPVLALSDTLLLTPGQVDSLRTLEVAWRRQIDSVFTPLSAWLAELPERYDGVAALRRVRAARAEAWRLTHLAVPAMTAVLTPLQYGILPGYLREIMGREPAELTRDFWAWSFEPTPGGMNMSINVGSPP